jgi:hypothetical protein
MEESPLGAPYKILVYGSFGEYLGWAFVYFDNEMEVMDDRQ